jgi:thermitase
MKTLLLSLATLALTLNLSFADNFHPNRLMVKVKAGESLPSSTFISHSKVLFGNVHVLYTNDLEKLNNELLSHPAVELVEKDYKANQRQLAKLVPTIESDKDLNAGPFNDPKLSKQWTFKAAAKHGISVSAAYLNRRTSPREQIIVAVVDTGVDYNHADLKNVMWTNPGEIAGNGIDDDGNGYIDDIHGINTLVRDSNGTATSDMMDKHSHGTHVSGSIGAEQNNKIGVAGVASNVRIMGIRTVPNSGDELDVDVVEAFVYAAKNGAKIINCSFGKARNEGGMIVSEAIDFIGKTYGTLVVAAAGNDSRNIDTRATYPATFQNENLLVVASTSSRGGMSYFSNYGIKNVDVAAPGSGIYSTVPGNRYSSMSGTSMASPNTAGLAAEVLSHFPELTPVELKKVLMNSVTKVSRFKSKVMSGGRIDLDKALELALSNSQN